MVIENNAGNTESDDKVSIPDLGKKIELSDEQKTQANKIKDWFETFDIKKSPQVFYLTGYAGTGKTTIISYIRDMIEKYKTITVNTKSGEEEEIERKRLILHAAFTGKAALQMKRKGCYNAQTIHSLIYKLISDDNMSEMLWELNDESMMVAADLLILDECSMVNQEMGEDLLSYKKPILVLGDPGQLPPVKGAGFFTNRKPNGHLKQVHRQALDNPIIKLSMDVRNGTSLKHVEGPHLKIYPRSKINFEDYGQCIVGKNATRININDQIRNSKYSGGQSDLPLKGDKIICTRNNKAQGLFNGLIGYMIEDSVECEDHILLSFKTEDGKVYENINTHIECFTGGIPYDDMTSYEIMQHNEFDYGYAITVHKAQGSQWDSVLFIDDGFLVWDRVQRKRWLYTGITRAANRLTIAKWKKGK